MGLMVIMGIVLVLMEAIMVYWYVDSIGGMLNPIGQIPKHYRHVKGLMVIMGIVWVLNGSYNGVLLVCDGFYWWDVKSYWENAQNTIENVMGLMVIMGIVWVLYGL